MKYTYLLFLSTLAILVKVSLSSAPPYYDLSETQELFEKFIKDYDRHYKNNNDREIHYNEFKKSVENINELNKKYYPTTTFGINQFADFTDDEKKKYGLKSGK
nr:venom protein U-MPTX.21-Mc24 [Megalopyge crispata]